MTDTQTVWIVETGDYEQRGTMAVYSSPEAAEAGIKATFGPPYIVRWEPLERGQQSTSGYSYHLTGHFEAVNHYSIEHTGHYDIDPWPVTP